MKKYLLILFALYFVAACAPTDKELTAEQINKEKEAIVKVMKDYNKAAEDKNFSALVETLASEVIFFGTDSAETIKTFPEFKKKMLDQWNMFDKQKYGNMTDVNIQMDKQATFASIIYGIPFTVTVGDGSARLFLRVSRTLKKENDKWVIVSGIVGSTNSVETKVLDELVQKKMGSSEASK